MSGQDPVQYGISRANTYFIVAMEFLLTSANINAFAQRPNGKTLRSSITDQAVATYKFIPIQSGISASLRLARNWMMRMI